MLERGTGHTIVIQRRRVYSFATRACVRARVRAAACSMSMIVFSEVRSGGLIVDRPNPPGMRRTWHLELGHAARSFRAS